MKAILSVCCIVALAACGGTTTPTPTPQPVLTPAQIAAAAAAAQAAADKAAADALAAANARAIADAQMRTQDFGTLLNSVRMDASVDPVTVNANLTTAAQSYAEDLLARNSVDHIGADGSTPAERAIAAGYDITLQPGTNNVIRTGTYIGENNAQGFDTPAAVIAGWQGSTEHRDNNEAALPDDFGLGYANSASGNRWVLLLGRENP